LANGFRTGWPGIYDVCAEFGSVRCIRRARVFEPGEAPPALFSERDGSAAAHNVVLLETVDFSESGTDCLFQFLGRQ